MAAADMEDESMQDLDPEGAIGEDEIDDRAHSRLLDSIYALDGKKKLKNEVRGAGIASSNLDLLVHTKKDSTKLKPEEVNLKRDKKQLIAKPLSTLEAEKAKRTIARDVLRQDTVKWEPIIAEIRMAPQTKYADRPAGLEMYKAMQPQKFSPRTPLEKELYEALGKSQDIVQPDQPLTKAEENALKAMSLNEAMERRRELLMHHELLTRTQVKNKRIKKIKSKRFRKGRRKEKEAEEKKKLELLKETDPEAFLEKIAEREKARMEERLTLKHRNGGKFGRYHKIYSKYDDRTREALQEMIEKGKQLKQKHLVESSEEEEEEVINPDLLRAIQQAQSGGQAGEEGSEVGGLDLRHMDMMKAIHKKAGGWLDGSTKYVYQSKSADGESSQTLVDAEEGVELLSEEQGEKEEDKEVEEGKKQKEGGKDTPSRENKVEKGSKKRKRDDSQVVDDLHKSGDENEDVAASSKKSPKKKTPKKVQTTVEEEGEVYEVDSKTPEKKQKVSANDEDDSENKETSKKKKKKKKKDTPKKETEVGEPGVEAKVGNENDEKKEIFLKPLELKQSTVDREVEEGDQMAVTMEELFEDEDVVEQFARDKAEEEEKLRPKEEDTKLPGWGSWSGPDYKKVEERRQTQRKLFLARNKPKPKEDSQPTLWLNPKRDQVFRKYQPKKVPFPFNNAEQYESALRQPVSRGFVRETAHKILIKPDVVTKLGHIIKPLDKDDFFKKQSLDDESFGKEIKYAGPINFRKQDERLKT